MRRACDNCEYFERDGWYGFVYDGTCHIDGAKVRSGHGYCCEYRPKWDDEEDDEEEDEEEEDE